MLDSRGREFVSCVTKEMVITEQERRQSSNAIDYYVNSSLTEEFQNYSFTLIQDVDSDY